MNTSKAFRQWAKDQGLPMPKYMKVEALINDGVGSFWVWVRPYGNDQMTRVEYLHELIAAARRDGKYARIIDYGSASGSMMSAMFTLSGTFHEVDIAAVGVKT